MLFVVLAVTGVMGYFLPFNILIVSVHSFLGFIFIVAVGLHIKNNFRSLRKYFSNRTALVLLLAIIALIAVILYQPKPVRALLSLSSNKGPALDHFEIRGNQMTYRYNPAPHYRMQLDFKGGPAFDPENPPYIAIWIENRAGYHIKSLYHSERENFDTMLPYWHHKRSGYLKHKQQKEDKDDAEAANDLDAVSSATENYSYDPRDYIVPADPENESPFRVLIEINMPGDANEHHPEQQPSLVYSVEVDNRAPRAYQVLQIVGYPKSEQVDGETEWALYFADQTITTAHDLFDSALLQIDRFDK